MPEIKHTPGPWRAVNLDEEGFFPSVYMGENLTYSEVERVTLNQRIDFEMRLNRKLPSQFDPIHDSNGRW